MQILQSARKMLYLIFLVLLLSVACMGFAYAQSRFGLIRDPISISGTGSMYPTFPKGQGTDSAHLSSETVITVPMRRFPGGIKFGKLSLFIHQLSFGDIVSFENATTFKVTKDRSGKATGFVKRVIGLPGDTIEIRDGFVFRNGTRLVENYTAAARSTFGGQSLPDCQELHVPEGYVFVLGDNRKSSDDSRHDLGLVAVSDVDHFLPLAEQKKYAAGWRDASADAAYSLKPLLDINEYLRLLNQRRRDNNLPEIKYQPKLEKSASKRADVILRYDDLSFTATKSGYTMEKALSEVGYHNVVWGETPTLGYYDAQELIDNYFEFSSSRNFLLNPDFQETGLSVKVGDLQGCPVQIVVQHLAGYKPPDYSPEVLQSWQTGLKNLIAVRPSWEKLKGYPEYYELHRTELDELLDLFSTRITRFQAIVDRMQSGEWLTDQEQSWIDADTGLSSRMDELISDLNADH